MSATGPAVPFDQLLAHRAWVRAVARGLAEQESDVDDLEQDAWLASLRTPPTRVTGLPTWFARVVRNRAVDRRRSALRRRASPLPDELPSGRTPVHIVAEADAHRRLVAAVMGLDEPYRTTVLARYFDDLPPRDVAARLGVPVETVRTRIRRAHELLRRELEGGARPSGSPWLAAVAPLLHTPERTMTATTAGALGGIAMSAAAKLSTAALVALALGVAIGWSARPEPTSARDAPTSPGPDALRAAVSERDTRIAGLERSLQQADARIEELERELAQRDEVSVGSVAETRAESAEAAPTPALPSFPALDPVLGQVDWDAVGAAVRDITPVLEELVQAMKEGRQLTPKRLGELQQHNGPLVTATLAVLEDLPGEGPSGAFCHPAFSARAIAATLAASGKQLSAAQTQRVETLAAAAIANETAARGRHGDATPHLRKVWDEADGRGRFLTAAFDVLDAEQQRTLRPESIRGRVQADLFCEGLEWGLSLRPVYHYGAESLTRMMVLRLEGAFDLDEAATGRVRGIVADWADGLPPEVLELSGDGLEKLGFGEFAGAKRAIAAVLDLFERILRDADLDADQRRRLIEYDKVPLPQLKTD